MIRFNVRSIAATVATLLALCLGTSAALAQASASNPSAAMERYDGMCEASAAVALDSQHFIVGDDESNALKVYRIGQSAPARPAVPGPTSIASSHSGQLMVRMVIPT